MRFWLHCDTDLTCMQKPVSNSSSYEYSLAAAASMIRYSPSKQAGACLNNCIIAQLDAFFSRLISREVRVMKRPVLALAKWPNLLIGQESQLYGRKL